MFSCNDYSTPPTPSELAEQDQVLAMAKDAAETGMWVFVQNYSDPCEVCWDCGRPATRALHVFVPPPDRTEVILPSCGSHWVATVRAYGRPPERLAVRVESAMWPLDVLPAEPAPIEVIRQYATLLGRQAVADSVRRAFERHRPNS